MKKIAAFLLLFFISISFFAQNHYWVFFTDKNNTTFNPYEYFDQKAIERRIKNNINLYDSTDFPVNQTYIQATINIVDSSRTVTRWFNGISVFASEEKIKLVADLPFVKKISPIFSHSFLATYRTELSYSDSMLLEKSMNLHEANLFTENEIDGTGIRIAVFDGGFPGVDTIPIFEHLRKDGRILKTYDFTKNKDFVYSYNSHGTNTLSCIAGIAGNIKMGMATGAEFLLARTEVNSEPFSEEENWLAAAEWADKNGVDIISSSLGYTLPRYFQYEMDGKSTFVAKAAKMASDKGILVINSMGNDGDGKWKVAGTPADVEEVLSVGGVDPYSHLKINFSSLGPTADGRMKPNVCATGKAIVAGPKRIKTAYGTSFSTPIIAGFAACVMQIDSSLSGQKLKKKIEESTNLYPYFDYSHGYGLPKASFFFNNKNNNNELFTVEKDNQSFKISIDTIKVDFDPEDYFYYHFRDLNGKIIKYYVLRIDKAEIYIDYSYFYESFIFMAHYKGYTYETKIN
ncbi:MAG: S8 family serine peptidase [Bacteroidota bacterium]|nr:S8 family serine peptidase [Bacteroidota bacterium]